MAAKNSIVTRRASRKKAVATQEARRRPATTSGPRLGTYARKHHQRKLTPGHKRVLRGRVSPQIPESLTTASEISLPEAREFIVFCIKQILTSANLVTKEGRYWRLRENIAGVNPGEPFTSLAACAQGIASSLQGQYRKEQAA